MDNEQALSILQSLANGIDPFTGATFPASSLYQHPDIVRALYQAVRALESATAAQKRQAARSAAAGNAGKPWAKEENDQLLAGFDASKSIDELAAAHNRSRLAIEARLAKFGRVPMPAGMRIGAVQAREAMRAQYAVRAQ
jgi:LmbE family N-acetylglucosaminyl deacetylase